MINFDEDCSDIDLSFGLNVEGIENTLLKQAREILPRGNHHLWGEALHEGNQTWVGLHPNTLQTPYEELREVCDLLGLRAGETVVDLGAGYGRLGFTLATLYPRVRFLGVEYVKERVQEGRKALSKLRRPEIRLIQGDLSQRTFILPEAQHYFIYDFGKVEHIRKILKKFSKLSDERRYKLVARGKGIRSLIEVEFPWLIEKHRLRNLSIYQG